MAASYFRVAVLSGKGGTGKTFVSVNLAAAAYQAFLGIIADAGTAHGEGTVHQDDVPDQDGTVRQDDVPDKDGTTRQNDVPDQDGTVRQDDVPDKDGTTRQNDVPDQDGTHLKGGTVRSGNIRAIYADCDVEEPNGHLFLQPVDCCCEPVSVMVPEVDASKCNGCRTCVSFCRFHALAYLKGQVKVFRELCHGCNGCVLLCPTGAMTEGKRPIGLLESGASEEVTVCTGTLNIGESTGVPVIHALLKALGTSRAIPESESLPVAGLDVDVLHESGTANAMQARSKLPYVAVLDCPPGSGCPVMESVRHADFCLLVAEPTAFGLHDLGMVVDLVRVLEKPAGLLFNRCTDSPERLADLAAGLGLPLLGTIPFEPALAKLLAEGCVAVRESDDYRQIFAGVWEQIREVAGR